MDFSQYLALLSVANVFLVTSLREGMALRTHEFVCCQSGRADDDDDEPVIREDGISPKVKETEKDKKGVLVLSEVRVLFVVFSSFEFD